MFLNFVGALIGLLLGGFIAVSLLIIFCMIYDFLFTRNDHSGASMGGLWPLTYILFPLGALIGLILGYIFLGDILGSFIGAGAEVVPESQQGVQDLPNNS